MNNHSLLDQLNEGDTPFLGNYEGEDGKLPAFRSQECIGLTFYAELEFEGWSYKENDASSVFLTEIVVGTIEGMYWNPNDGFMFLTNVPVRRNRKQRPHYPPEVLPATGDSTIGHDPLYDAPSKWFTVMKVGERIEVDYLVDFRLYRGEELLYRYVAPDPLAVREANRASWYGSLAETRRTFQEELRRSSSAQ